MFGAPANPAGAFSFGANGGAAPGAFGAAPAAGAGAFGAFGAAPAAGAGAFGAPAAAPAANMFGAFGAAPAANTAAPGAFGAFGSPTAGAGAFGAPAATPGAFGAPAGNMFGAPAAAPAGAFGAPAGNVFGAAGGGAAFGGGAAGAAQVGTYQIKFQPVRIMEANATFFYQCITASDKMQHKSLEEYRWEDYQIKARGGAPPAAAPGAFSPTPAAPTSAFGAPPAGAGNPFTNLGGAGAFGAAAAPAAAPNPFGAPAAGAGAFGASFAAPAGAAGNPFSFGAAGGAPGAFGTAPAAGAFGAPAAAPTSTFGAFGTAGGAGAFGSPTRPGTTSAFGTPAAGANPFGAPAAGAFGAPAAAPNPFGAPAAGAFGAAPAANPFGAPAAGAFGTPAAGAFGAPAVGAFGATPAFGAAAPAFGAAGAFGSPTRSSLTSASTAVPAPGYGAPAFGAAPSFGAPAAGAFGTPAAGAFGAPAAGAFGTPAFGAAPSFGAPAAGAFGAPAGGAYGAPAAPFGSPTGSFGAYGAPPAGSYGVPTYGAYGAPAYGMQPTAPAWSAWGQTPGAVPAGAQPPLYAAIEQAPFGVLPKIMKDDGDKQSATPAKAAAAARARPSNAYTPYSYKITPRSAAAKLLPRGALLAPEESSADKSGKQMFVARSAVVKKLVIETSADDTASPLLNREVRSKITGAATPATPAPVEPHSHHHDATPMQLATPSAMSPPLSSAKRASVITELRIDSSPPSTPGPPKSPTQPTSGMTTIVPTPIRRPGVYNPVMDTGNAPGAGARVYQTYYEFHQDRLTSPDGKRKTNPNAPILTKKKYFTAPSIAVLSTLPDEELAAVVDFVVGKEDCGTVQFLGVTDVRNLNLDKIVQFSPAEISVYPNEDDRAPEGEQLNKRAVVTLFGLFAKDKNGRPTENESKIARFEEKLRKKTEAFKGRFVSYDYENGAWKFQVEHFSKYGLGDDSDDESDSDEDGGAPAKKKPAKGAAQAQNKKRATPSAAQRRIVKGRSQAELKLQKPAGPKSLSFAPAGGDEPPRSSFMTLRTEVSDDSEDEETEPGDERSRPRPATRAKRPRMNETAQSQSSESPEEGYSVSDVEEEYPAERRGRYESGDDEDMDDEEDDENDESPSRRDHHQAMHEDYSYEADGGWEDKAEEMKTSGGPNWNITRDLALNPSKIQLMHASFLTDFEKTRGASPQPQIDAMEEETDVDDRAQESPAKRLRDSRYPAATTMTYKPLPSFAMSTSTSQRDSPFGEKPVAATKKAEKPASPVDHFLVKSFRVSWAPGGLLIHTGRPTSKGRATNAATGPSGSSSLFFGEMPARPTAPLLAGQKKDATAPTATTRVQIERVVVGSGLTVKQHYLPFLLSHLQHTTKDVPVPYQGRILPTFSIDTANVTKNVEESALITQKSIDALGAAASEELDQPSVASELATTLKQQLAVWKLVQVLWVPGEYAEMILRRLQLSQYLQKALRSSLRLDINELQADASKDVVTKALDSIFLNLTALRIQEAVDAALSIGEHRLALLLTQATSPTVLKQSMKEQLHVWSQVGVLNQIHPSKLRIYRLLAGDVDSVVSGIKDWRRVFGLYLWFGTASNTPLDVAVRSYTTTMLSSDSAVQPRPPYVPAGTKVEYSDTLYELLMLYQFNRGKQAFTSEVDPNADDPTQRAFILQAVQPLASQPHLLDARLSWHLNSVLTGFQKFSKLTAEQTFQVALDFASQLEFVGLWDWAIYVILNISANNISPASGLSSAAIENLRVVAVRAVLSRHANELLVSTPANVEKEQFLTRVLGLPESWLHEFKAWRLHSSFDRTKEVQHLLASAQWEAAHQCVVNYLAPTLFFQSTVSFGTTVSGASVWPPGLREILLALSDKRVRGWEHGGAVFLDLFNLSQEVQELSFAIFTRGDIHDQPAQALSGLLERLRAAETLSSQLSDRVANWCTDLDRASKAADPSYVPAIPLGSQVVSLRYRELEEKHLLMTERVCIAEITARLVSHLKVVKEMIRFLTGTPETNKEAVVSSLDLSRVMAALPLPQNHRLDYLSQLTSQYLLYRTT